MLEHIQWIDAGIEHGCSVRDPYARGHAYALFLFLFFSGSERSGRRARHFCRDSKPRLDSSEIHSLFTAVASPEGPSRRGLSTR